MIQRLDHTNKTTAVSIRAVFQKSYAVEAELLGAVDFPPLQRTVDNFLASEHVFFGFYMDEHLAAVIEVATFEDAKHIQSLVVLPRFFRLGIASGLLSFVPTMGCAKCALKKSGDREVKPLHPDFCFHELLIFKATTSIKNRSIPCGTCAILPEYPY